MERAGGVGLDMDRSYRRGLGKPVIESALVRRYQHYFSVPHSLSVSPPWTVLQSVDWSGLAHRLIQL